ncbi:hypothetical protein EON65_47890 [archaeon]|nr:MAG: hypothetical protein EON65_47890 [archaeon]
MGGRPMTTVHHHHGGPMMGGGMGRPMGGMMGGGMGMGGGGILLTLPLHLPLAHLSPSEVFLHHPQPTVTHIEPTLDIIASTFIRKIVCIRNGV